MSSPNLQTRKKVESSGLKYFLSESLSDSRCRRRLLSALNPMKIGWWIRSSSTHPSPYKASPAAPLNPGGYVRRMLRALGPLTSDSRSKETLCPSLRESNATDWHSLRWKNTSFPSAAAMKPNPRSVSFLIFPTSIYNTSGGYQVSLHYSMECLLIGPQLA